MPKIKVTNKLQKQCEKDFCDKYVERIYKFSKKIQNKLIEKSKANTETKHKVKKKQTK